MPKVHALHIPALFGELGDIAGEEPGEKADESAAKRHKKERQYSHQGLDNADRRDGEKGLHGVVQHHRHAVIEQRLAKDEEVKTLVDMDFLEKWSMHSSRDS